MSITITATDSGKDFTPHPEGIHPAVCVDVIDLGLVKTEFQGETKLQQKIKIVFETEQKAADGSSMTISKNFTASLHPKAQLNKFIAQWRGRPVVIGESIDFDKMVGACCTLVVSHQQNIVGRTYAAIDAVSKPTKKLTPAGTYDKAGVRERSLAWVAKNNGTAQPAQQQQPAKVPSKSNAPAKAQPVEDDIPFDSEVGF